MMHLTVRMAWHDNKWNGKAAITPKPTTIAQDLILCCLPE